MSLLKKSTGVVTEMATTFMFSGRNSSSKPVSNGLIKPIMINRNPRNLERLRLEKKPLGYVLDKKDVEYWHKLNIIQGNRFVCAQLVHNSNAVVVEASTNEWAIRKFLYSGQDKQAYIILAKVFAERCLESGMTSMKCAVYNKNDGTNIGDFVKTLEEEGLQLEEAAHFNIYDIWRRKREKRPWTVLEDSF